MHVTVWEEPALVLYRVGGAGSGTLPLGRNRLRYCTALGGADSCNSPCEMSRLRYFTAREEAAHLLYRVGRAGLCTLPCGKSRIRCTTAWKGGDPCTLPCGGGEPAPVLYHLGGADSCTVPWEVPATVLDRMGGAGSGTVPLGRSRLKNFTVWEEPAPVLYRLQDRWPL